MRKNNLIVCTFCENPAVREISDDLDFFSESNRKVFLCMTCYKIFNAGSILGQFQLNNKMINLILSSDDSETVVALKNKLSEIVPSSSAKLKAAIKHNSQINPKEFYELLSKKIIGQETAKRRLSIAIYEHIRNSIANSNDKNNILFLGPSGSGKTLIVNTISKHLEVPFVSGDATGFSPTGFQGADADSCVHDLLVKSNGSIKDAQKGIIFIDEIDKLASSKISSGTKIESFHYSTQSTMLKLIEGKRVKVPSSVLGEHNMPPTIVDTSRILFCFGGAFNGLSDIVGKKLGHVGKKIGLAQNAENDYSAQIKSYELYEKASHDILAESLIEYGLSTELVGRIQTIVPLIPLTKDQMIECLLSLEDSPILKNKVLFAESNIELEFADDYFSAVAEKAIKTGTGTRALNSIVKTSVSQAAFEFLGSKQDNIKIIITKKCIDEPGRFETM